MARPTSRRRFPISTTRVNRTVILSKFAGLGARREPRHVPEQPRAVHAFRADQLGVFASCLRAFEDLLRPENKVQLQRIVLFQLVSGRAWDLKDLGDGEVAALVRGQSDSLMSIRRGRSTSARRVDHSRRHSLRQRRDGPDGHAADAPSPAAVAAVANADARRRRTLRRRTRPPDIMPRPPRMRCPPPADPNAGCRYDGAGDRAGGAVNAVGLSMATRSSIRGGIESDTGPVTGYLHRFVSR